MIFYRIGGGNLEKLPLYEYTIGVVSQPSCGIKEKYPLQKNVGFESFF